MNNCNGYNLINICSIHLFYYILNLYRCYAATVLIAFKTDSCGAGIVVAIMGNIVIICYYQRLSLITSHTLTGYIIFHIIGGRQRANTFACHLQCNPSEGYIVTTRQSLLCPEE